ncbi:protein ENHANCED DOWNY MILDEW 2 isoform X1 [Lathyrus oleraceus]|uniref:protein ENHANCED DOWNY MILDEW 2 isoform X1 n=1 Tax=Pisum sativum TaxID=3888 RepID=UPI0021D2BB71|nr:protein ENHANCED DOWNY MILDEW 2-like isoform X1 [Pisum sativum]XP_050874339.1 protein ENHANCED DOWNY MILDEW 2-like isoform X1 [Pisum sativum]XP_050874340.1 protein ENHANCED DOWNY MILDEW 2-like isoform X1 [Pisum sativum]XP_050874341.1 protein ENHANCED DOWNY MILDEW 2-like isoform X1 [Pisum sativum]
MASSDEEGEIVPDFVDSYWFENDKAEFVSLFSLTLLWSVDEVECDSETKVFLRGITDNGIQKIHKQITGWRFELSCEKPEISVLLREKYWIALLKPKKCFESTIRSVLVTVSWLHFVKWNPEESRILIWNKVLTEFSSFDIQPSENDVLSHMTLITEAAKRDTDLTKSKYLLNFIGKTCSNDDIHEQDVHTTKKLKFIVDSEEEEEEEKSEVEGELNVDGEQNIGYDTVCAICDNGGEILPCEGRCLRSFHATVESGRDSLCESLGYTSTQVNAFPNFYCDNCRYKKHQCFACGRLGSSDESSNPEVFPCVTANCGYYYHPECVARLLNPGIEAKQEEMRQKIAIEKTFVCPLHICSLCRKGENRNVSDLQFATCRRCPKAYHRKCLPKEISFIFDYYMGFEQRAWDNLLDKRILMYCLDHEIVPELGTPARNHLIFPDKDIKRKKISFKLLNKEKVAITSNKSFEELLLTKTLVPKLTLMERSVLQGGNSSNVMEKICSKPDTHLSFEQPKKYLKVETMSASNRCLPNFDSKVALKNDKLTCSPRLHEATSQQQRSVGRIEETSLKKPSVKKVKTSLEVRKADMEKRILSLMEEATSTLNMEKFKKEQVFNTSSSSTETVFHKNLTQGKVEGSIKAIQIALQKLDEGCSIEEAKAICEPEIVRQLFIWQKQLKVYLAPFLHGMRYTSFGRHFTKIDKLKEIVDRLHWYVQNGDTVLDFCCGANDFSCLMKSKLDQTGKSSCSFKNYDLFQAKNDFNFEKRDWMSVKPEELPDGSQLIIGLNPPFGVKGFLANKFINKALTFKPKLLILIVPKVTKRLDRKKGGYDLIWEDEEICSGKSFYLPGSVDTRDKQLEDWNLKPPPLYLWSRPDWSRRHIEIAQIHCHIKHDAYNNKVQEMSNYLMEENLDCYMEYRGLHAPGNFLSIFDGVPDDNGIPLEDSANYFP